jgi:hypothetical protein
MNKEIELITQEEEKELNIIRKDVEEGFKNLQMFRSEFLMRSSVLGMHPTIDGKYWQAVLERNVHWWELMRLGFDFKEKVADIDIKKATLNKKLFECEEKGKDETEINDLDKQIAIAESNKIKIQIDRDSTFLIHMRKEAEQRFREVRNWTKIISELRPQLKYSESNAEEYQPEEYANLYMEKLQIMDKTKGNKGDFDGLYNTMTVAKGIFNSPDVIKLIDKENKNNILRNESSSKLNKNIGGKGKLWQKEKLYEETDNL